MTAKTPSPANKRYSVRVDGYDAHVYEARSASAARYQAYKAYCEATNPVPLLRFVQRTTTYALGPVETPLVLMTPGQVREARRHAAMWKELGTTP